MSVRGPGPSDDHGDRDVGPHRGVLDAGVLSIQNSPVTAESASFRRRGAMATGSTRRVRRYSVVMALGLMTAFTFLARRLRSVHSWTRPPR